MTGISHQNRNTSTQLQSHCERKRQPTAELEIFYELQSASCFRNGCRNSCLTHSNLLHTRKHCHFVPSSVPLFILLYINWVIGSTPDYHFKLLCALLIPCAESLIHVAMNKPLNGLFLSTCDVPPTASAAYQLQTGVAFLASLPQLVVTVPPGVVMLRKG